MIVSYKGRSIDIMRPVRAYRNLHKEGRWYSILQDGKVCGHSNALMLTEARFIVNQRGRALVLSTGQKNVHAYVEGYVSPGGEDDLETKVTYNPRESQFFRTVEERQRKLAGAQAVCLNSRGVTARNLIEVT